MRLKSCQQGSFSTHTGDLNAVLQRLRGAQTHTSLSSRLERSVMVPTRKWRLQQDTSTLKALKEHQGTVYLVTIKDIQPFEELFAPYGIGDAMFPIWPLTFLGDPHQQIDEYKSYLNKPPTGNSLHFILQCCSHHDLSMSSLSPHNVQHDVEQSSLRESLVSYCVLILTATERHIC